MRLLNSYKHKEVENMEQGNVFKRITARGIIMQGEDILLIYTKRYNDYGFPGGGVDPNEALVDTLIRELAEETGAQNVKVIKEFGVIEELLPTHLAGYDAMQQTSYFYICTADRALGQANPEAYELKNGSEAVWVNIHVALQHNKDVILKNHETIGFTIPRETYVLEKIVSELLN